MDKAFNVCGRLPERERRRMSYLDRLRRRVVGEDRDATEYECADCGAGFEGRRQVCPECGGYSITRREWESAAPR
jgi:rubrerythrin